MDNKILRLFIYIFSGLIVIFSLLMVVNYLGSLAGSPGRESAVKTAQGAEAQAQAALMAAKQGLIPTGSLIPSYRGGLSTAAVKTDGAIMLVKEKTFGGVAETPKDLMSLLGELGGGDKRKPAPIAMKDADLDKKITVGGLPDREPRLAASTMPEMGRQPGNEGVTLLSAPVDYKVFKSSETWWTFAASRKCRSASEAGSGLKPEPSSFASPDFSRDAVVVLVSVSELPNGIFKIVKVEKAGKELRLDYKVDPLAMAAGGDQHDFYSAAVIPKNLPLKLRQVP